MFTELQDGTVLEIMIDSETQVMLAQISRENTDPMNPPENYLDSSQAMYDFFEGPLSNSEYQWISPEQTGDLTDAPILGILDENDVVTHRWAYMDYAVKSPLVELMKNGRIEFVGGSLTD